MPSKEETLRGKRWQAKLRRQGAWVEKLHGSVLSGIPDYLVGTGDTPLRFTEAKTLEAVQEAKRRIPANACTRAQCYFLDMVVRCGGSASLLVLCEDSYLDLDWRDAAKAPLDALRQAACLLRCEVTYSDE